MSAEERNALAAFEKRRRMRMLREGAGVSDVARKALGPVAYAITCLMSRSKLNWVWHLEPEQRLCVEFADKLREAARDGRLRCVFTHCANEGKRHGIVAAILRAMGMIPGAPDFWFIWAGGGGLMEFKRPDKKLPELEGNQAEFKVWAESAGVRHAVHNSVDGALGSLREWGCLV